MHELDFLEAASRVFLALVLGGLIGLEREFTQKSAGLRTHILVTIGATVFTWVSLSDFGYNLHHSLMDQGAHSDPSRVAAQIVTGIGFIGGGAVLRYGPTIRGLTTAASLWSMASIGMLAGIGQKKLAIVVTLVIFLVLFTIGKLERWFFSKNAHAYNRLRIHIISQNASAPISQIWIESHFTDNVVEARFHTDASTDNTELDYIINVQNAKKLDLPVISREICALAGVQNATVKSYFEDEYQS